MATVMFDWEQGGGLGHLMQMLPLAEGLARKGHRGFMAVRDLVGASAVFDHKGVLFLPAPHKEGCGLAPCRRTLNFAHVLINIGWDTINRRDRAPLRPTEFLEALTRIIHGLAADDPTR